MDSRGGVLDWIHVRTQGKKIHRKSLKSGQEHMSWWNNNWKLYSSGYLNIWLILPGNSSTHFTRINHGTTNEYFKVSCRIMARANPLFYFFSQVSVSEPALCLLETLARACFTVKSGVHFKILCEESWKTDFKCSSLSSCARRSGASRGRVPVSCDLFVWTM